MRLKADKSFTYFRNTAELQRRVADGPVSQFEKMRQLRLVKLANALPDILRQNETEKGLKLRIILRGDEGPAGVRVLLPGDRRKCERNVGQHVVKVAVLGIDHALDLAELLVAVAFFGQAIQQRLASV